MTIILLFVFIVALGAVVVFRLLAPEMYVRLNIPRFNLPWNRSELLVDSVSVTPYIPSSEPEVEKLPIAIDTPMQAEEMPNSDAPKLDKLEALLLEKNKLITRLSKELDAERSHRLEFEKVKNIMDGEIHRLKDQLKNLKQ